MTEPALKTSRLDCARHTVCRIGYNSGMWQYAQLTVTYDGRLAVEGGEWTITWYGPGVTTVSKSRSYADVVARLNGAGDADWDLVDVAALDDGGNGHLSLGRDWSLTRYTFRRPSSAASSRPSLATGQSEDLRQSESRSADTETDHSAGPSPSGGGESAVGATVTAVRFAVYWQPDRGASGATGRFVVAREAARLHDPAEIDTFIRLGWECDSPGVTRERREQIKAAAADYAASWTEGQWGDAWWQTPQGFPLSRAADLFDGSAEWLRSLIEHPTVDVLSAAGVDSPMVTIGAGVAANFVTAPVTAPLEGAARLCEIAGIVIGALTGMHALVMACGKRLAHDEAHRLLGKGFERVIGSFERGFRVSSDSETGEPGYRAQRQAARPKIRRLVY